MNRHKGVRGIEQRRLVGLQLAVLSLALGATPSARAQQLFVGQEQAIIESSYERSEHARSVPGADHCAQSGNTVIAWTDDRPFDPQPVGGFTTGTRSPRYGLYTTALDSTGQPLNPSGQLVMRSLGQPISPQVSCLSSTAFITWLDSGRLWLRTTNGSGRTSSDEKHLLVEGGIENYDHDCGARCYLTWQDASFTSSIHLAPLGSEEEEFAIPPAPEGSQDSDPAIAASRSTALGSTKSSAQLVFRRSGGEAPGIYARLVDRAGFFVEQEARLLYSGAITPGSLSIAQSDDTGFLVAWIQPGSRGNELWMLLLDADGAPRGAPAVLDQGAYDVSELTLSANDFGYHLLWSRDSGSAYYLFVEQDGEAGEAKYLSGSSQAILATGGTGPVIAASFSANADSQGDIFARVLSLEGELNYPFPNAQLLSGQVSGLQTTVDVVAGHGEYLVTYRNRVELASAYYAQRVSARGQVRGERILLPGEARFFPLDDERYLMTYRHEQADGSSRAMIGWLDTSSDTPRVTTEALFSELDSSHLIAAQNDQRVLIIGRDEAAWVEGDQVTPWSYEFKRPQVMAAGNKTFLLAWEQTEGFEERVWAQLISREGAVVGEAFQLAEGTDVEILRDPSIAFDGKNYLVVAGYHPSWTNYTKPVAVLIDEEGKQSTPRFVAEDAAGGRYQSPRVIWDGTHFLVAWSSTWSGHYQVEVPFLARVSAEGEALEPAGVRVEYELSLGPQSVLAPMVASQGNGNALLLYTRQDWSEGGSYLIKARQVLDPSANGQPCSRSDDCASGICEAGLCGANDAEPSETELDSSDQTALGGAGGAGSAEAGPCSHPGSVCIFIEEGDKKGCGCSTVGRRSSGLPLGGVTLLLTASLVGWRRRQTKCLGSMSGRQP